MKEEQIKDLDPNLKDYISSLKETSKDTANDAYMCESKVGVINFDKIPKLYAQELGVEHPPKSNDALYISEDEWSFIEFKNGEVKQADIYRKIYDSLIMLVELKLIPDFKYAREKITYTLVYNAKKQKFLQQSESRDINMEYMFSLAGEEMRLFGIEKLRGYLLKDTHTYKPEEFEKMFVKPKEQEEAQG